jgi:hypothetical protein
MYAVVCRYGITEEMLLLAVLSVGNVIIPMGHSLSGTYTPFLALYQPIALPLLRNTLK